MQLQHSYQAQANSIKTNPVQMNTHNILLLTDSYKVSHYKQYPPKTEIVFSYFESRGGKYSETCFFGLQYFLKKYLEGSVVTQEKIDEADQLFQVHFGNKEMFNRTAWEYILKEYNGHLPVKIKAVPEGSVLPYRNVLMTIENTDPRCYWLTNYLETLLVQVWYPTTVATQSHFLKKLIGHYLEETGTPADLPFKLHDFGFRGVSSVESAGIGGAAHLVNFSGTDTLQALQTIQDYYNTDEVFGFSVPASEHSTMTSWTRSQETAAYKNMLDQYPTGNVSVVSDSYDIFNAAKEIWGKELKDHVLERDGTLVIRPDSGDILTVILLLLNILDEAFGSTTNAKGYKLLHPKVRILQGDGMDAAAIEQLLKDIIAKGWSADNLVFGMGGGLLQKINRDTLKFAFKCSWAQIDGKGREVYKDPITDPGKKSKRGRLKLIKTTNGNYQTVEERTVRENKEGLDLLETVFENGKIVKEWQFEEVRANITPYIC